MAALLEVVDVGVVVWGVGRDRTFEVEERGHCPATTTSVLGVFHFVIFRALHRGFEVLTKPLSKGILKMPFRDPTEPDSGDTAWLLVSR